MCVDITPAKPATAKESATATTATKGKPAFAVGQRWRGPKGHVMEITRVSHGQPTVKVVVNPEGQHRYDPSATFGNNVDGLFYGSKTDNVSLTEIVADAKPGEVPALVVGQKWRAKDGNTAEVVSYDGTRVVDRSFWEVRRHGKGGARGMTLWHLNDGRCNIGGRDREYDLVELISDATAPVSALTFRAGGTYRTRDGRSVTLRDQDPQSSEERFAGDVIPAQFSRNSGRVFRANGTHAFNETNLDLVAEIGGGVATVEVKPGMLIRGLRVTSEVDTVLAITSPGIARVSTRENPQGIGQEITEDCEVRWPWESDDAWRRVTPKKPKSDTVDLDDVALGEVLRTRGGKLVHYVDTRPEGDDDGHGDSQRGRGEQPLQEQVRYLDGGALNWVRTDGKAHRDGSTCPDDIVEVVSRTA